MNLMETDKSKISWCSREEWQKVSWLVRSLQNDETNEEKLRLTISILNCLMSRVPTPPIGAKMTSELLQAFLTLSKDPENRTEGGRQNMAFAIIRFVNYISHAFQKTKDGHGLMPLLKLAAQQDLPEWIVTLRHDAAHGALPAAHLSRAAMSAALHWVAAAFWQDQPAPGDQSADCPAETDAAPAADALQRLESMLAGARGRRVSRSLLLTCLNGDAGKALDVITAALLASAQDRGSDGVLPTTLRQSWVTTLSVVSRCGLLVDLMERLLTSAGTPAAAAWLQYIARAAQRSHTVRQESGAAAGHARSPGAGVCAHLVTATAAQLDPVNWDRLVHVALRQRQVCTGQILNTLLDGLSPPVAEWRRHLLVQLLEVAAGRQQADRAHGPVTADQLRKLGIGLPDDRLTETLSGQATVASPTKKIATPPTTATTTRRTANGVPSWSHCSDVPEWRHASEIGRLPWQSQFPTLAEAMDTAAQYHLS